MLVKSAIEVLDEVYGLTWTHIPFVECELSIQEWCKVHDAHYYGRPTETFSLCKAIAEAEAKGHSIVVVEYLS